MPGSSTVGRTFHAACLLRRPCLSPCAQMRLVLGKAGRGRGPCRSEGMNSQVWQVTPGGEARPSWTWTWTAGPLDPFFRPPTHQTHRPVGAPPVRRIHTPAGAAPGGPRGSVALASCESEAQSPLAAHHPAVLSVLINACRVVPFIKEDTGPDPFFPFCLPSPDLQASFVPSTNIPSTLYHLRHNLDPISSSFLVYSDTHPSPVRRFPVICMAARRRFSNPIPRPRG
jgi:hypothetical protein